MTVAEEDKARLENDTSWWNTDVPDFLATVPKSLFLPPVFELNLEVTELDKDLKAFVDRTNGTNLPAIVMVVGIASE